MKFLNTFFALLLSVFCFAQKKYDVVITNITVINTSTGKAEKGKNIYIKNDQIEITSEVKKIAEPKVQINGTGNYFMPALFDMHVHYPDQHAERFFKLQTAAGIATSRVMKTLPEATEQYKNYTDIPNLKLAYNFFGKETYPLDSIATIISSLKRKGYHFIKIFGIKNEAFFDEVMAAALKNNITVCGHALSNIAANKLLSSGYKSIEHVGYFDKAKTNEALDSLVKIAVKNNVFVCPTLDWSMMVYHSIPQDSLKYRSGYAIGNKLYNIDWDTTYNSFNKTAITQRKQYADFMRNDVAKKIEILKKMRANGLMIIAGSDAEEPYQTPGFSLVDELLLIKKAGYSNLELLKMVTENPMLYFGNKISDNKDFILLSENPLTNISNLSTVKYLIKGSKVTDTKKLIETIK